MNGFTLYHGSHDASLSIITNTGTFGGIFASSRGAALSHGNYLYMIDSPLRLTDYHLNYEIQGAYDIALEICGGNELRADAIMTPSCEVDFDALGVDAEDQGEYEWELQRLRGVLAAKLGYTSIEMSDEHGTTYLCLPGCSVQAERVGLL